MGQSSGGLCANTVVAAPTATSPAHISLVCFWRELYDSPSPNDKHKIFPSPQQLLVMALEVFCYAALLGIGKVCDVPQRLYQYTVKRKPRNATAVVFLPCAASSDLPGLWGVSFRQHIWPHFLQWFYVASVRWPLVTKQLRATLECESWHEPWSQSCLPIPTRAHRLKSPSVPLLGHEQQPPGSAFHFFFTGCLFLSCLGTEPKHSPPMSLSCSCTSCLLLNLILLNTMCLILITCPSPMKVIEI